MADMRVPLTSAHGWVRYGTGTELGAVVGLTLVIAGLVPRSLWLDSHARMPNPLQLLGMCLTAALTVSIAMVVGSAVGGSLRGELDWPHLLGYVPTAWWLLGWGLAASAVWSFAATVGPLIGYVVLVIVQSNGGLWDLPHGGVEQPPVVTVGSAVVGASAMVIGLWTGTVTRLGARGLIRATN